MTPADSNRSHHDLRKVLEISRAMVAARDLDELLGLIIDRTMELLDAERASLFLYDPERNELVTRIAAGVDEIRFPADRGIAGATIQSGSVINIPDAYADERFNPDVDRQTGFHTHNILSVPLRDYEEKMVGVLQVLNRRGGPFADDDVTLAETLAAQAGVAIQRATLIRHYMHKLEMERAMRIARDIQRGLLPRGDVEIEGFELAGFSRPADETGGDIYDFMPLADGRWMLMVADATGHGIGPALVVAQTRAMLRAMCLHGQDVSTILRTVNNLLGVDMDSARFVTCFLGVLDPAKSTLTYASAGHGPLLFYRRQDDHFDEVGATDLPLGVIEDTGYDEVRTLAMAPGDLAVITTDGFFETTSSSGELYGVERIKEMVRCDRDEPPQQILDDLYIAVVSFGGLQPQADDLTGIVIRKS